MAIFAPSKHKSLTSTLLSYFLCCFLLGGQGESFEETFPLSYRVSEMGRVAPEYSYPLVSRVSKNGRNKVCMVRYDVIETSIEHGSMRHDRMDCPCRVQM